MSFQARQCASRPRTLSATGQAASNCEGTGTWQSASGPGFGPLFAKNCLPFWLFVLGPGLFPGEHWGPFGRPVPTRRRLRVRPHGAGPCRTGQTGQGKGLRWFAWHPDLAGTANNKRQNRMIRENEKSQTMRSMLVMVQEEGWDLSQGCKGVPAGTC